MYEVELKNTVYNKIFKKTFRSPYLLEVYIKKIKYKKGINYLGN